MRSHKLRYPLRNVIPAQWILSICLICLLGSGCATVRTTRMPDSHRAKQVVQFAKSLQGKPYRYGGATPQGFDCSGFVQYVYAQAVRVRLPRTSQAQFAYGKVVNRGSEEPSDLLFFDINGRGISHVGIYLGQGLFIHAPQSGGRVKISNANESYWRQRFRGLRRLL